MTKQSTLASAIVVIAKGKRTRQVMRFTEVTDVTKALAARFCRNADTLARIYGVPIRHTWRVVRENKEN